MDEVPERSGCDYQNLKQTLLENYTYASGEANEEVKRSEWQSQCHRLRVTMIDTAIQEAKRLSLTQEEGEALVSDAADIGNDLAFSCMLGSSFDFKWLDGNLTAEEARQIFCMTFPATTQPDLIHQTRTTGRLKVENESFEDAVARYLGGQIRSLYADRIILTVLADMEITAYLEAMLRPNLFTGRAELAEVARRPLLSRILRPSEKSDRLRKAEKLIEEMTALYGEMHSVGQLSVPYLTKRFDDLRQLGTRWPNSLWTMLDDLNARGVKRI